MKKSAYLLAAAAGAAFASIASAQAVAPIQPTPLTIQSVRTIAAPGVTLPSDYNQRLLSAVYQYNATGAFVYWGAIAGVYDDLRYNALLGAAPDANVDSLEMFLAVPAANTETGARVHVELYNTHTAGIFPPYTVLLSSQNFDFPVGSFVNDGAATVGYDVIVAGWNPVINTHDNTIGAYIQIQTLDGTAIHPTVRQVLVRNVAPTIGTTLGGAYLDVNNDGAIGTGEGPFIAQAGDTALHACLILNADVAVAPPANPTALTLTECGTNTQALNLAAGEVKWFKLTVPAAGINAADLEALTIDTETAGSTADTVLGVYDSRGNLLIVEDDDGTGALSQMSFGIGRWAGPGDGQPYDGRNGDLPAGDYYIAVTAFGEGLFFDEGFAVTPGASAAASFNLNANFYTETCLPSLLAPTPDVDLGTVLAPSNFPTAFDMTAGVRWYKFNVCTEIADPAKYFDVDFSPSTGDLVAVVFDSNGNEVAFSDDADADANDGIDYFLPQFSFGNTTARPAGGLGALPLAGQDGTLPPGDYYMAVGGFPYLALPEAAATAHGRFYFFGSALTATDFSSPVLFTDVTSEDCSSVNPCPPCAADYDQDGGVTGGDLGAFFTDFEQGLPCADVDQDGGVTGGDLGVFFTLFEAGGC